MNLPCETETKGSWELRLMSTFDLSPSSAFLSLSLSARPPLFFHYALLSSLAAPIFLLPMMNIYLAIPVFIIHDLLKLFFKVAVSQQINK